MHLVTAARSNPTHSRHIALMHAERGALPANTRLRSARTDCGDVDTLPARFWAIFRSKSALGVSAAVDVAPGRNDSRGFIAHLRVVSAEAVDYAWELWEESQEVLQYGNPAVRALRKPDPIEQHWKQTGRFPKRFPVKLDDFLRLMLPHLSGRTAEKLGIFREYLKFRLRNPSPPPFVIAHDKHGPMKGTPFDCLNPRTVPPTTS